MKRFSISCFAAFILIVSSLSFVEAQPSNPALTVNKTGKPITQLAPGTITWNITVTNTGDVPLTGINVTDSIHGYLGSVSSLSVGQTIFFVIIESNLPPDTYYNEATAYGYYAPLEKTVSDSDEIECIVRVPRAGILLTKTPSKTKVVSGSVVSYLYNVTNTGETALTGGIVDDVYGSVGNFVNLAPGGWVGFNVSHAISVDTTNVATAFGVDSFGANVTDSATNIVQVYSPTVTIESCKSTGIIKNTFDLNEDVYVIGNNYAPLASYNLYIVTDELVWTDGMAIPARVTGSATSVTSDALGNVATTLAWSDPLILGKYDIIVDVNDNGIFDAAIDALDNSDIQVTAGFFVIPESPFGTLMITLSMISGLIVFVGIKKRAQKILVK